MRTPATPLPLARAEADIALLPAMANRHGLIAGATGTGKTVSMRVMAERFSDIGVPVFLCDVKGDLSGLCRPGGDHPKVLERVAALGLTGFAPTAYPVVFWDVFGQQGHPARTTVSELGPLLLARVLGLNDTQSEVLTLVFRIADDAGLLLLDIKDLRAMVAHVGERAADFRATYGNVSPASVGSIQRRLTALEEQGADLLFGEPAMNLADLMQTDEAGRGHINILGAARLMQAPTLYGGFLLWLLSELFETLPELGDPEKPCLALFFDEAHLLFDDAPKALVDKIEQVARLIRSKGVGVYFVTQSPLDLPADVLGQLGNRIQHALRAFTPRDQQAVRAAAQTFRVNPGLDVEQAITELGVGEALVSFLDENGTPGVTQRALIHPPQSRLAPLSAQERAEAVRGSIIYGAYEQAVDRESAYEVLATRARQELTQQQQAREQAQEREQALRRERMERLAQPKAPAPPRRRESLAEAFAKSAVRTVGSAVGRQLVRGLLGSLLKGR